MMIITSSSRCHNLAVTSTVYTIPGADFGWYTTAQTRETTLPGNKATETVVDILQKHASILLGLQSRVLGTNHSNSK